MLQKPVCLWIGSTDRQEFADPLRSLRCTHRVVARRSPPPETATGEQSDSLGNAVRLIVLAVARAGDDWQRWVEELQLRWPDVPIVALQSDWTDEFRRSSAVWPENCAPIPTYRGHDLAELIPSITASPTPVPEPNPAATPQAPPCILVVTQDSSWADAVNSALSLAGWIGIWCRDVQSVKVAQLAGVLVDLPGPTERRPPLLAQIMQHYPDSPIIACVDFPRSDERKSLVERGCQTVIAKPIRLEQLLDALSRLVNVVSMEAPKSQ